MALLADEQFSGGQVRDINGRTVVATDTLGAALGAGEQVSGGRVRDADGRMVVAIETASATLSAGEQWSDGEVRDSQGRLVVVVDSLNAALAAGERASGGQVRDQAGRRVIASDTGAVALLAGEQVSGGQVRDQLGRMVVRGAGVAVSAYNTAVLADSPLMFLRLNDTSGTVAVDSAPGNLHPGTYTGSYTLAQTGPCSDGEKSVTLTSTGYVTVASAAALALPIPWTLEMWVNATDFTTYQFMFCKWDNSSFDGYRFYGNQGAGTMNMSVNGISGGTMTTVTTLPTGAWAHVAVSDDGTNAIVYLNGASVLTHATLTSPVANAQVLMLGHRVDGLPFVGSMAKAALYGTALSGTRIAAHYAAK